ncbi:MAG: helix-turn-helix transcriptional regulator [Acidobacteriota bacterium]
MARLETLGQFEQLVLTAVLTLEDAYGVTIHRKVETLSTPRRVTLGAVYVTLDRLEDKGYLSSWLSEPTAERGGRAKRCYKVEGAGELALRESMATAQRIWDTLNAAPGNRRRKWKLVGEGGKA